MRPAQSAICLAILLFLVAAPLRAQEREPAQGNRGEQELIPRKGAFYLAGGGGLTYDVPLKGDIQLAGEYFLHHHISIGLSLDDWFRKTQIVVARAFARYHFDIPSMPKLVPYLGGAVGGGMDTNGNGIVDIMPLNIGYKYALSEKWHIGSDVGFHAVFRPGNKYFDIHFLVITLAYRF